MRRRAQHCLHDTHWDPFERHILRLIADHAHEIGAMRQRIVAAKTDPRVIAATRHDLEQALDDILSTFTPEHVALAGPVIDLPGAPTPANLLAGLLTRAMGIVSGVESRITNGQSSNWELHRGMDALGLSDSKLSKLFLDRAEVVMLGTPPAVVQRMVTLSAMGDPEGRMLREAGLRSRMARARHYVRTTIHNVETELAKSSWLFDEIVAERMRLETWSLNEGPDATLEVIMKVVLEGMAEWTITARVRDHGRLPADTCNRISSIKHDGSILLGRRLDRDARGIAEDHPSMAAAPLVAALRWREVPEEVPIDPSATVHLEGDVRLSKDVLVHAPGGNTCWIDVDQPLPDTIVAAMVGRPITDLVEHPWLDPRIIVKDSMISSRGAHFLVEIPRARLMPVDEDDGDPVEEWGSLQNQQCLTREEDLRNRRRAEPDRVRSRDANEINVHHRPLSHGRNASRTIGTHARSRRGVAAIMTAVALTLLMIIVASIMFARR